MPNDSQNSYDFTASTLKSDTVKMHKIFLSHSGQLSSDLAEIFQDFLRKVTSCTEVFHSSEGIPIGDKWAPELDENLLQARYGLFFITKANAKSSGWMLYEAGAIAAVNHNKKRVVPILVDITASELTPIYASFEWMSMNQRSCRRLLLQINKECSESVPPSDIIEHHFAQEWPLFIRCWETTIAKDRDERQRLEQEAAKKDHMSAQQAHGRISFDADTFYTWTYAFHNVIHRSREICVKLMSGHARNDELPSADEPGSVPPPHPSMKPFEITIHNMLDDIREVFEKLPETSDCGIRVCLRDLRRDGKFYTFARSVPPNLRNPNVDNNSVPIPKDCFAFKALEETWSEAKCVIETTPDQGWGQDMPHRNDAFYNTKTVLVGSVIAKNVKDGNVFNAYTIWALFVSSDKNGVFKDYHRAILQGCIDAFSCMANVMLRKEGCAKSIH